MLVFLTINLFQACLLFIKYFMFAAIDIPFFMLYLYAFLKLYTWKRKKSFSLMTILT